MRRLCTCVCLTAILLCFSPTDESSLRPKEDRGHEFPSSGLVVDEKGVPVAGIIVRVAGSDHHAKTNADGRFNFPHYRQTRFLTAEVPGYYIGIASANLKRPTIRLQPLPPDFENYPWVDPHRDLSKQHNCGNCHETIVQEWSLSGHARSGTNRRFQQLYDGSDEQGRTNIGWSLLRDDPNSRDVCASCHTPTMKPLPESGFDMRNAKKLSPGLSGVHCDFCHKIRGLGEGEFGTTHGRYFFEFQRPDLRTSRTQDGNERQLFFGPLRDAVREDNAFSAFQRDSKMCAACHEGIVIGVPVYTTYTEWLKSPAQRQGKSCQSCHMAPTRELTNLAPLKGGIERDPDTLAQHHFFAPNKFSMMRNALVLHHEAQKFEKQINLTINLSVEGVGHAVPTGFIDRQLILLVESVDGKMLEGPQIPDFVGKSVKGKNGLLFARVLEDRNKKKPAPFWNANPASLIDTRLTPGNHSISQYSFTKETTMIRVTLLYRNFWESVAIEKGWPDTYGVVVLEKVIQVAQ